ncbi:hypothetical protein [Streptomyces monomycini]|uniref:hypothetical protein n=1 Tax=Streptomyces monomycini TaxID=371720 RepID=UPI0012FE831C|nr:hypothetical protein [Streptomyces monomycini]
MSLALVGAVLIAVWVLVSGTGSASLTCTAVGMSLLGARHSFLHHLRVYRT